MISLIKGKKEGGEFSRFKSWEYCHQVFYEVHSSGKQLKEEDVDLLALHLSFYLASWGMYRGSTFILQRDYKTHKEIVRRIFNKKYGDLWRFDPSSADEKEFPKIAKLATEAYSDIVDAYGEIPERYFVDDDGDDEKPISMTLITKILMGTFAICPAFDRFFKDGIHWYNKKHENIKSRIMGPVSHYEREDKFESDLINLFIFAKQQANYLNTADTATAFAYPIMKKVDMFFWEVGYEKGFLNSLEEKVTKPIDINNKKSIKPIIKLINQIQTLFNIYVFADSNYSDIISYYSRLIRNRLGI